MKNIFLYLLILIGCGKVSKPNNFEGCWQCLRGGIYTELCLKDTIAFLVTEDIYRVSGLSVEYPDPRYNRLKIYRYSHPFMELEILEEKRDSILVKDIGRAIEYHLYKIDMEFPSDSILNDKVALDMELQKFTARMFAFSDRWKNK